MTRLILQPASNPNAQEHYRNTIESRVSFDRLAPFVSPAILQQLGSIYTDQQSAYVWGAVPGRSNSRYYEEMQEGDILLFYRNGEFFESFVLALKTPDNPGNADLARQLWRIKVNPRTGREETWEHIFFLRDRKLLTPPITYTDMHNVIEFGPPDMLRGLTVLDEGRSTRALDAFNLRRFGFASAPSDLDDEEQEELLSQAQLAAERKRGQGFRSNVEMRRAIERYAMLAAEEYFANAGYNVKNVSHNNSYDLHCTRGGKEVLVEVKGTATDGLSVFLTGNEVELARRKREQMALYILKSVEVVERRGEVQIRGGTESVYWPWDIDSGTISLVTVAYMPGSS